MRVTVVQTSATAADIAGYQQLWPSVPALISGDSQQIVVVGRTMLPQPARRRRLGRPGGSAPARTTVSAGGTSTVTVVRPSRRSVGGGPRARPAIQTT